MACSYSGDFGSRDNIRQKLNSDLPGQVIGQVTENIYDTVTGRHLLIPQGAKVIGSYESRNSYGDNRAFVTWSRLILPNGNSMTLDDLGAVDGQGFAGLHDKVDSHTGKVIKASVLSSIFGVGTELASVMKTVLSGPFRIQDSKL